MTNEDKLIIDKQTKETLAIWHCKINCSETVDELPNPDDVNYSNPKPMMEWTKQDIEEFKNSRAITIMRYIESIVGSKAISKEWNKDTMNDEEFEDFWKGTYEGDIEAKKRDTTRALKKIATRHNIDHTLVDWIKSEEDILNQMGTISLLKEGNK